MEDDIERLLQENEIKYEHSKKFKDWLGRQHLDFYLPEENVAIECQGRQHFEEVDFAGNGEEWAKKQLEKVRVLDCKKQKLCKEHGIKILYFSNCEGDILGEKCITDKTKLLEEIKKYGNN